MKNLVVNELKLILKFEEWSKLQKQKQGEQSMIMKTEIKIWESWVNKTQNHFMVVSKYLQLWLEWVLIQKC